MSDATDAVWWNELDLLDAVARDSARLHAEMLKGASEGHYAPTVTSPREVRSLIEGFLEAELEARVGPVEVGLLPPSEGLEVRIVRNTSFRVRDAEREIFTRALALTGAFGFAGLIRNLLIGGFGLDLARGIWVCLDRLEDPAERAVFEAVAELQTLKIANYDALAANDLEQAFDEVGPTKDEIMARVGGPSEEAMGALQRLESRRIVSRMAPDGTYRISF